MISWRNLFIDLENQLREHDGDLLEEQEQVGTEMNKNVRKAAKEESLSYELDK